MPSASFGLNYSMVEPNCLNFSIIKAIFQMSKYLGILQYVKTTLFKIQDNYSTFFKCLNFSEFYSISSLFLRRGYRLKVQKVQTTKTNWCNNPKSWSVVWPNSNASKRCKHNVKQCQLRSDWSRFIQEPSDLGWHYLPRPISQGFSRNIGSLGYRRFILLVVASL